MKYIIILILLLSGFLFFVNKDDILSKYSGINKAEVLSSESNDYEEPVVNRMSKTNSSSSKPLNKVASSTNGVKNASLTYYNVSWATYLDGKLYDFNYKQRYEYGTLVRYWLTDFEYSTKNSFFLGWFGAPCREGEANTKSSSCSFYLDSNTEVITKWNNCAKPFPEHVFFENINSLERKLVQFANNKGDVKLKINAKGEVGALAVVYSDGAVCARFTEGCVGEVTCDINDDKDFFKSYKEKSIKNMLTYHTHDYNSGSKYWSAYNNDGTRINTILSIPPSFSDLKINWYFKEMLSGNNIFPKLSLIEKVISPTGEGYIYDVTKKSIIAKAKDTKLDAIEEDMVNDYSEAQDKSMFKNKRKYPILKDIQVGIDHMITSIKKLNVNIRPFIVN